MKGLTPDVPEDSRILYGLFRQGLAQLLGDDSKLSSLALLATRHVMGEEMLRLLLIGPSGSGKTTIARALSEVLAVPMVEIQVGGMSEEGWAGTSASQHLGSLIDECYRSHPSDWRPMAERSVVVLDELCKARIPGRNATPSHREQRAGKQVSLLPIVGDGTVRIERMQRVLSWRSKRALVVATGVFHGLPTPSPSPVDLHDWGMLKELAERFAAGTILHLSHPTGRRMTAVLERSLMPLTEVVTRFGYELHVDPASLTYLTNALAEQQHDLGPRAGIGVLRGAVEALLLRLLDEDAPPGTRIIVAPDDLRVPPPPRGLWRD